jgi:hypothetical protein
MNGRVPAAVKVSHGALIDGCRLQASPTARELISLGIKVTIEQITRL